MSDSQIVRSSDFAGVDQDGQTARKTALGALAV